MAGIVVVWTAVNFSTLAGGVDGFLSARITVKNVLLLIVLGTAWPLIFHIFGLYRARVSPSGAEVRRLIGATTAGCGLALVFPLMSTTGTVTVAQIPYFGLAQLTLCLLVRVVRREVTHASHRHSRRALIIGTGHLAQRAYADIQADRTYRYEVVGFVDDPASGLPDNHVSGEQIIATLPQLEQILMREVIDEVVIALPVKSRYHQIQDVITVCERAGVQAKYGADMFHSTVAFPRYDAQGDRAFVAMQVAPDDYRLLIKRAIDIVGAAAGLFLCAPVMLIVAAGIKLTSRGPIVYPQDRCGFGRRRFRMYKFRSMRADAEQLQASLEDRNEANGPVFKIRSDPRVTWLGRVLRKSSIDELPQFWNVLRGDMSLVGPRPLPWRDVSRITRPSDMRRFSMRPGITCLWQVEGRCNIDFERWVELDLAYIDNWSLALDARILARTIPAVVSGNGAE